jgi:DNA-binding CsgD family transcriptional regulator
MAINLSLDILAITIGVTTLLISLIYYFKSKNKLMLYYIYIEIVVILYLALNMTMNLNLSPSNIVFYPKKICLMFVFRNMLLFLIPLFFHTAFSIKNIKTTSILFGCFSILNTLNVLSPWFIDFETKQFLPGFYLNYLFGIGTVIYLIVLIFCHLKKLFDTRIRLMLIVFCALLAIFTPLLCVMDYELIFQKKLILALRDISFHSLFYSVWNILFLIFLACYIQIKPIQLTPQMEENPFFGQYGITAREKEIIFFMNQGLSNKQIGSKLFISELTVKSHIQNIYKKLNVGNKMEMIKALNIGQL